jgi:hypothetical protein
MCSVFQLAPAPRWCAVTGRPYSLTCDTEPLFVPTALTFVLAPLPNALFAHCGHDDFASEESTGPVDLGRFITSIIVVTGFAFPIVLAHSGVIHSAACLMSIVGGGCVFSIASCC